MINTKLLKVINPFLKVANKSLQGVLYSFDKIVFTDSHFLCVIDKNSNIDREIFVTLDGKILQDFKFPYYHSVLDEESEAVYEGEICFSRFEYLFEIVSFKSKVDYALIFDISRDKAQIEEIHAISRNGQAVIKPKSAIQIYTHSFKQEETSFKVALGLRYFKLFYDICKVFDISSDVFCEFKFINPKRPIFLNCERIKFIVMPMDIKAILEN